MDFDINDQIRAMADAGNASYTGQVYAGQALPAAGMDWGSGLMQSALALGQTYLSRRIDIDLQGRLAGMQATVQRASNQSPLNESPDLTSRGVQAVSGIRLGNILPLLVIGGAALLLLRR